MNLPNSGGVIGLGSMPRARRRVFRFVSARPAIMVVLSFSMIAVGVSLGTQSRTSRSPKTRAQILRWGARPAANPSALQWWPQERRGGRVWHTQSLRHRTKIELHLSGGPGMPCAQMYWGVPGAGCGKAVERAVWNGLFQRAERVDRRSLNEETTVHEESQDQKQFFSLVQRTCQRYRGSPISTKSRATSRKTSLRPMNLGAS